MTLHSLPAPSEYICPLTLEVMQEPLLTRWGHNFERSALLQWLQLHDCCPLTRNCMTIKDVIANRALKERIAVWQQGRPSETDREDDVELPLVLPVKSS